ncbi:hypothetical protein [Amnibacterium sp.]|uniref:hypothetical protein n=1 Tax=Amnibacterium sp. TaxID=1872496 RepID=UPI003F7C9ACD
MTNGPYRLYIVHTGSMEPTIPTRSAVVVQLHRFHVGEPVAFMEQGSVITHRLLSISSAGTITTKGDANTTADPWHPPVSAVLGGVIAAPPNLGYWLFYFKTPMGLISVLLAGLVCWQLWAILGPRPHMQISTTPPRIHSSPDQLQPVEENGLF